MKPNEFIRKYNLNSPSFEMSYLVAGNIVRDLGQSFDILLSQAKNNTSDFDYNQFKKLINQSRKKWDSLNNKLFVPLPDSIWNSFYVKFIVKNRDLLFPEIEEEKKRIFLLNNESLCYYILKNTGKDYSLCLDEEFFIEEENLVEIEKRIKKVEETTRDEFIIQALRVLLGRLKSRVNMRTIALEREKREADRILREELKLAKKYFYSFYRNEITKEGFEKLLLDSYEKLRSCRRDFVFDNIFSNWIKDFLSNYQQKQLIPYLSYLGITKEFFDSCSILDIKKLFKQKVHLVHPDKGGDFESFIKLKSIIDHLIEIKNKTKTSD